MSSSKGWWRALAWAIALPWSFGGLMHARRRAIKGLPIAKRLRMLDQVPGVAVGIGKYRDGPIDLAPRLLQEPDAFGPHRRVVAIEIIGLQEKPDASTSLVADRRFLAP